MNPSTQLGRLATAVALVLVGAACGDEPVPSKHVACQTAAECQSGEICAGGTCAECQADAQCLADYGAGATCGAGACQAKACPAGALGCACDAGACAEGVCQDGVCAECPAGAIGCPCGEGDACDGGVCSAGTCVACARGAEGCACLNSGRCDAGLRCSAETCVPCAGGEQGCPCGDGAAGCADDLVCDGGLCVPDPCPRSQLDCLCTEAGACDGTLYCLGGTCAACSNDVVGCPCDEAGACDGGLVCDAEGETCREARTCDEAGCAAHQTCQAAEGADAECLAACDDGWVWNAEAQACDEVVVAHCGEGAGSIAADCAAQHRACVPAAEGASCGACLDYFVADGDQCRPVETCASLGCEALVRDCVAATATLDAACTECLAGHVDEGGTLSVCRATYTCEDVGCEALSRACTPETASTDAACGACLDGFVSAEPAPAACAPVQTCEDLACADQHRACTPESATSHAVCGECEPFFVDEGGTLEGCRPVATCLESTCAGANRQCTAATATTDAVCGACLDYFVPDEGDPTLCRAVLVCEDVACGAQHRDCVAETPVADAFCGACAFGFEEQAGQCVDLYTVCVADGSNTDISSTCAAAHRACVDPGAGEAYCGDCLDGYALDLSGSCVLISTCESLGCAAKSRLCTGEWPSQACGDCFTGTVPSASDPSVCVPPPTCAELACGEAQFCKDTTSGGVCVDAVCGDGMAYSEWQGKCVTCFVNCGDDAGETGRTWPYTLSESTNCLCEVDEGYYWDQGVTAARPCDADGDGWVREAARTYMTMKDPSEATYDVHQAANTRCALRAVDRVVLENEWGQRLAVKLCDDTEPLVRGDEDCASKPYHLALYETTRNDDQSELAKATTAYAYAQGATGRKLVAAEANGLARVCVQSADYNDNGLTDIREWHGLQNPGSLTADQAILAQFGYYAELHRSWIEDGPESTAIDQLVIQERSRCEPGFPLHYGASTTSGYWRECTRSRASTFDRTDGQTGPDFGLDFARWSCDATKGSCPIPPPPTEVVPTTNAVPEHGLCGIGGKPLDAECADGGAGYLCVDGGVWRGMSHHSQFRCVVVNDAASTVEPRLPASAFTSGQFLFNQCAIACPEGDPTCASDCADGVCATSTTPAAAAPNPSSPVLSCAATSTPASGSVGFAVTTFRGPGAYTLGCIDEWEPKLVSGPLNGSEDTEVRAWRTLCPGYQKNPDAVLGQGSTTHFGQLQCGCGENYGGVGCATGCPTSALMLQEGYETTPRTGYWMCGGLTATGYEAQDPTHGPALVGAEAGSAWVLRGEIPAHPHDGAALCQTGCSLIGRSASEFGSESVCGATPATCQASATWAQAKALCDDQGMRLCTVDELEADEANGSGCGFDDERVWSASACGAAGYYTAAGATSAAQTHPTECSDAATTTAAVRCCLTECSGFRIGSP